MIVMKPTEQGEMPSSERKRSEMPRFAMGSTPVAPANTEGNNNPGNGNAGDPPNPTENQPANSNTNDDSAIAKAYEKLRDAEHREKEAQKELKRVKEQDLPEAQRKAQEADALRTENADLKTQLQTFAAERIAAGKGFVDPEAAVATLMVRKVDISDRAKAEKALDDLAAEKQGLVGTAPPPSGGPINPASGNTPSGDAGMNQMIRRRAGRA